jgi:hypothetical protein
VLARDDRVSRRSRSSSLTIERLRIIVMSEQAMRGDRFSDHYANSWPELWSHVMGLDHRAEKLTRADRQRRGDSRGLPLLALPRSAAAFVREADHQGFNARVAYVRSQEDVADSSLHHELGFHPRILDRLVREMRGEDGEDYFPGLGRAIQITGSDDQAS